LDTLLILCTAFRLLYTSREVCKFGHGKSLCVFSRRIAALSNHITKGPPSASD